MKSKRILKKGYIFQIDMFFAITILIIGYLLISGNDRDEKLEIPIGTAAQNVMDVLSNVKISELCPDYTINPVLLDNDCTCFNQQVESLCKNDKLKNPDQSMLDYFGELYYTSKLNPPLILGNSFVRTDLFGIELLLVNGPDQEVLYANPPIPDTFASKEKSNNLISSKKVIFGYYENRAAGEVSFWGPYTVEVNIWEK